MGVDLYLEDEEGAKLAGIPDPHGYVGCIVSLAGCEHPVCVRFIDLYGDTVFNQIQIPVLIKELESARDLITDERVASLGQQKLEDARAGKWDPAVVQAIESSNRRLSASSIRAHLEQILDLARRSQGEVHTYLKFYGD